MTENRCDGEHRRVTEVHKAHQSYQVPYAETDQMGVVYYANYLVYFERARTQLLNDLGLPYKELERRGLALPVVEAHVEYKKPAEYDDTIDIYGWLAWTKGPRVRVNCEVCRKEALLARGFTVHACLDRHSGRIIRIPPEIAACFSGVR
jgi:acyl-CoA thioester hydrolase